MRITELNGYSDNIFNSRASLDTLFEPLTVESTGLADVLIVGFEDGTVHFSIYESFEIGSFNIQQASRGLDKPRPLLHCSNPLSTTHSLLVANSTEGPEELYVLPVDFRMLSNAGRYLSLLASKLTQLRNLLCYVQQVRDQLYSDFKASLDLPRKLINNVEETLRGQTDCDWVQAAYHLVVTGHCFPEIKEWLVDQLGERV